MRYLGPAAAADHTYIREAATAVRPNSTLLLLLYYSTLYTPN